MILFIIMLVLTTPITNATGTINTSKEIINENQGIPETNCYYTKKIKKVLMSIIALRIGNVVGRTSLLN